MGGWFKDAFSFQLRYSGCLTGLGCGSWVGLTVGLPVLYSSLLGFQSSRRSGLFKCNSMLMHFASSAEPFAFEVVHRFPRPGLTGVVVAHIQFSLVNR